MILRNLCNLYINAMALYNCEIWCNLQITCLFYLYYTTKKMSTNLTEKNVKFVSVKSCYLHRKTNWIRLFLLFKKIVFYWHKRWRFSSVKLTDFFLKCIKSDSILFLRKRYQCKIFHCQIVFKQTVLKFKEIKFLPTTFMYEAERLRNCLQ